MRFDVDIERSAASGVIAAPPSKSMTHRALICAALAHGESIIENPCVSGDTDATIRCLSSLGARFTHDARLSPNRIAVIGNGGLLSADAVLDAGESASTLRFLIPVCLSDGQSRRFIGSERLFSRPLGVYESFCAERGWTFERSADGIAVRASDERIADVRINGGVSSQFATGLMLALPLGKLGSLTVKPPIVSRPYIEMTRACLTRFGVCEKAEARADGSLTITASGAYAPCVGAYCVEGDRSNAAFFAALEYTGGNVRITGLEGETKQGDAVYPSLFADISRGGCVADLDDCPDLAPVAFVVAALCGGASFTGISRLRDKESDRGAAMAKELAKCGVTCQIDGDRAEISGIPTKPSVPLCGHNDHRVVMALSVLLTATGGTITGAEATAKSLPEFFGMLSALNVRLTVRKS